MKIRLVSHASVVLTCTDTKLWTDPWLLSKAFNDSWTLYPAPDFAEALLDKVEYLWLSHEHPDHLNFPTLASLPNEFKGRVTILFQDNNAGRIFEPLRKLGFRNFTVLPHRKTVTLTPQTRVYCYRVGTLDSCLAVMNSAETILNVNDARINQADCDRILKDVGPIDVVLNQFSIAVKELLIDYEARAPVAARSVLEGLSADHLHLGAKVTIPFASFMYFSAVDNKHMNAFSNKPRDSFELCRNHGQTMVVLYPGDEYEVNQPYDSSKALARYDEMYAGFETVPYDVPPVVSLSQMSDTFHALVKNLRDRYPLLLLRRLRPICVRIPDLNVTIDLAIANDSITEVAAAEPPDIIIHSQPLHYCLAQTWGMGTLIISGRFQLRRNIRNWKMHKALFALNNAEVYLRPRYLFRRQNWAYLKDRLSGLRRYTDRTRSAAKTPSTDPTVPARV